MTAKFDIIRTTVSEHYAGVARAGVAGTCCGAPGCCDDGASGSQVIGYSVDELAVLPDGADLGLGCGNPIREADLQPGETVLDLGSGAGIDCFLAAKVVGGQGRALGVDMTPDMLHKARANAERTGVTNVEFRLGEIEHLPVADATVDAIISNCVLNLSPNKAQVLRECFRVLKPGGRLCISDVVAEREMPETMRSDDELICGCIGSAALIADLQADLAAAGFAAVAIEPKAESASFISTWAPGSGAENYVVSAIIRAVKPA
ncbi:MAG: arsenite methyltransferase [Planctomycetota bacterium]|jgi:SAM-dependent methyltransferase